MAAASVSASAHAAGRENVRINILDACDPETFAAQQVDCTRAGGVKFDQFIAILTRLGFVGPWHFSPSNVNVRVGESFVAVNQGGEVHTFTEVAQFGGGIVPPLNDLAHVPVIAPECGALEADDFVPPGGSYHEDIDHTGTLKFQCCIHPWMRLEANVTAK
jgi:plastocyanin